MHKLHLRKQFLKDRLLLPTAQVDDFSIQIANRVLKLPLWNFSFFHIFLSIAEKKEIDTQPIISLLQGKDKHVVIPKIHEKNNLHHYLLTDSTLFTKNSWGIPEPIEGILINEQQLDVVFVPLLAFDKAGNRVGYGGGFYDVFLKNCRKDVVKVGLSLFEPVEKIDGINEFDIPLNYCVTPTNTYEF